MSTLRDVEDTQNDENDTICQEQYDSIDMANLLVELGCEVDIIDFRGFTPLSVAAYHGNTEMVKTLVKHGANVNYIGFNGLTPLCLAITRNNRETTHVLAKLGGVLTATGVLEIVSKGQPELMKLILEVKADISVCDVDGWNGLHFAASDGNTDAINILLDSGIDIMSKTRNGWTALHLAAVNCRLDSAKLLVERGAFVNASDIDKYTPLYLALRDDYPLMQKYLKSVGGEVILQH